MVVSRRQFLNRSAQIGSLAALSGWSRTALRASGAVINDQHFRIESVERTTCRLEFRETPRRNMDREIPHWRWIEICDVKLSSGVTGTGETMLFYTWGTPSDAAVQKVIGQSALEMMWDDSLGAGLQMALFDAVGRTGEVPVHSLLGNKVHQTTPLSWWNIDTSAQDMRSECQEALKQGYLSYKTKGRPWFDVFEQVRTAAAGLPAEFKIDMDFNDTLRTAEQGMEILLKLAEYPQVDIYESPIPQSDVEGNRKITAATDVNIAMHYGNPKPRVCVQSECCDGFVVGGGAGRVTAAGRFCGQVQMPFWLQLVGAGLTAAHSLHFGGVLQQARWPAVNCHQLFETDLLTEPIVVQNGHAAVPDRPGLGYEIDRDKLQKLKVDKPKMRPEPKRLIETTWADGRKMYTANNGQVNFMLTAANREQYPFYAAGAHTRLLPNDGSARWQQLYEKARTAGRPIEG